jgi:hypothetical protein
MPLKARDLDDKWSLARASARLLRASSEWAGTLVKVRRRDLEIQSRLKYDSSLDEVCVNRRG